MLPNRESGPQNQPKAKVAVSTLVNTALSFVGIFVVSGTLVLSVGFKRPTSFSQLGRLALKIAPNTRKAAIAISLPFLNLNTSSHLCPLSLASLFIHG
jgi:hypothetical protein